MGDLEVLGIYPNSQGHHLEDIPKNWHKKSPSIQSQKASQNNDTYIALVIQAYVILGWTDTLLDVDADDNYEFDGDGLRGKLDYEAFAYEWNQFANGKDQFYITS